MTHVTHNIPFGHLELTRTRDSSPTNISEMQSLLFRVFTDWALSCLYRVVITVFMITAKRQVRPSA
jgi:hypothetical protein